MNETDRRVKELRADLARAADCAAVCADEICDYMNAAKMASDEKCTADEQHCACVPLLRVQLAAAREALAKADEVSQWLRCDGHRILADELDAALDAARKSGDGK